jgi:hypothetical protein
MRGALLLALLGWLPPSWVEGGRFGRINSRCEAGRSGRGLECSTDNLAFFEFAPASGAGMGSACACTTPTGAKGEALTFTRTGDATCSRSGLATTGIANGDLVTCAANLPRVEPSGGVLGVRVEGARTFSLQRFIDIANALWSDVGTPTLTGGQASPWTGALSTSAVQVDDNDAAAQEGRSQTVTVTAAVAHTMHCYVKAGTLTSAAISLDGTVAAITGLVTTSWDIIEVTDASSSGVAISAQILNGSTAAGTGTVIWGGCAVEAGSYRTSIMPTVASAVTRNAESAWVASGFPASADFCAVASVQTSNPISANLPHFWEARSGAGDRWGLFAASGGASSAVTLQRNGAPTAANAATFAAGSIARGLARVTGTTSELCLNGSCASGTSSNTAAAKVLSIGVFDGQTSPSFQLDGIVTRVQTDPSPSRCTP